MRLLRRGELAVSGRLADASNLSLVGTVTLDDVSMDCVYKPVRGERPLWDFPDGTLAQREVAAYRISRMAGWMCVPPTVLRAGPFGDGMVQQWVNAQEYDDLVDLLPMRALPDSWLPVLRARDEQGGHLVLAHADDPRLAVLAAFDVVVNNADRKASHILPTADGQVYGVDHGLTLHADDKLRTILWGFAGRPLPAEVLAGLERLQTALADAPGLERMMTRREWAVLNRRLAHLIRAGRYPSPPDDRTPIPWPLRLPRPRPGDPLARHRRGDRHRDERARCPDAGGLDAPAGARVADGRRRPGRDGPGREGLTPLRDVRRTGGPRVRPREAGRPDGPGCRRRAGPTREARPPPEQQHVPVPRDRGSEAAQAGEVDDRGGGRPRPPSSRSPAPPPASSSAACSAPAAAAADRTGRSGPSRPARTSGRFSSLCPGHQAR